MPSMTIPRRTTVRGTGRKYQALVRTLPSGGVKMVYTASIEMQTLEFDQAAQDIASLVESMGGYFEQKNFSNYSSSYRHASYTVRVPAEQFTDFCTQVGTLCHVTWQSDTAENISERYYDTQSRLETAQIKLERLQELLKKGREHGGYHHHRVRPSRRRSTRSRTFPARCDITTRWWAMRPLTLN